MKPVVVGTTAGICWTGVLRTSCLTWMVSASSSTLTTSLVFCFVFFGGSPLVCGASPFGCLVVLGVSMEGRTSKGVGFVEALFDDLRLAGACGMCCANGGEAAGPLTCVWPLDGKASAPKALAASAFGGGKENFIDAPDRGVKFGGYILT